MKRRAEIRAAQDVIRTAYGHGFVASLEAVYPSFVEPVVEVVIPATNDPTEFNGRLGETARQRLKLFRKRTMEYVGWIDLLWGNSAWELVHDFTDNEDVLQVVHCSRHGI